MRRLDFADHIIYFYLPRPQSGANATEHIVTFELSNLQFSFFLSFFLSLSMVYKESTIPFYSLDQAIYQPYVNF
jgi:hypothetical protein